MNADVIQPTTGIAQAWLGHLERRIQAAESQNKPDSRVIDEIAWLVTTANIDLTIAETTRLATFHRTYADIWPIVQAWQHEFREALEPDVYEIAVTDLKIEVTKRHAKRIWTLLTPGILVAVGVAVLGLWAYRHSQSG